MDFDSLKEKKSGLGTAGVIVMNKQSDIIKNTLRLSWFYAYESCGQCTPCWEGTPWLVKLLEKFQKGDSNKKDIDMLFGLTK